MLEVQEQEKVFCADCNYEIENDDWANQFYNNLGEIICENCSFEYYNVCRDCDTIILHDDSVSINYGQFYVCENCAYAHYNQCDHCRDYFSNSEMRFITDDFNLCYECGQDYGQCYDCGNIVHTSDMEEIDRHIYCDECAPDHEIYIHDYDYTPHLTFYGHCEKYAYFGIEIEIDYGYNPGRCSQEINEIAGNYVYTKRDGSLSYDGIEIVSHPATIDYHMTNFPWKKIFHIAKNNDYKSHDTDTCGLHVHVDRKFFGNTRLKRDLNIAKTILLIEFFWGSYIVPFSRRNYEKLERWAKKPDCKIKADDLEIEVIDKIRNERSKGRYQAVNLTNHNTVEFRFFRGTLNYSTFISCIQFLDVLIKFAKKTDLKNIFTTSFQEIFLNTEYEELENYLISKNLLLKLKKDVM